MSESSHGSDNISNKFSPHPDAPAKLPIIAALLGTVLIVALIAMLIARHPQPSTTLVVAQGNSATMGISGCSAEAQNQHYTQSVTIMDLAMVSDTDGWAVGGVTQFGGVSIAGVILHDVNGNWQQVAGNYPDLLFTSISMITSTDGWIAGIYKGNTPTNQDNTTFQNDQVLYHYDGHNWRQVQLPQNAFNPVQSSSGTPIVRMYSATDGWLVLTSTQQGNFIVLHYDGSNWQQVQSPFQSSELIFYQFNKIATNGPDDLWVAGNHTDDSGNSGGQNMVIAHYSAGQWSTFPHLPSGSMNSFALSSPTSGWIISNYTLQRLTNQQVSVVSLPSALIKDGENLFAVTLSPDGTLWVTGGAFGPSKTSFLLHQLAGGSWKRMDIPYPGQYIGNIVFATSTDMWMISAIVHMKGCAPAAVTGLDQGTIIHWNDSQWSQTIEPIS